MPEHTTVRTLHDVPSPSLRIWPGVLLGAAVLVFRFVLPLTWPETGGLGVLGTLAAAAGVLVWWLFFSRAPLSARLGALLLVGLAAAATFPILHESIASGMMGMLFVVYALPLTVSLALVAWAAATRYLPAGTRRLALAAVMVVSCVVWTLVRTDGVTGEGVAQLAWRWTPTAEERLMASMPSPVAAPQEPAAPAQVPAASQETAATPPATTPREAEAAPAAVPEAAAAESPKPAPAPPVAEWPGFRGPLRDGIVRGIAVSTDWASAPPVEIWRRPVGPGWSSFAVGGGLLYTQEQRGEQEIVSAYRLDTGEPVWTHADAARFYESNGGPGPRATPTLQGSRVYTLGATGVVSALDARTGAVLWTRNAATDTGATLPGWGFAGSPVAVGDAVIVAASGHLVSYEAESGAPRWIRETAGGGYSSPHLAEIDGERQVLLPSGGGITSVDPRDGRVLWEHRWVDGVGIVQPAIAEGSQLLVAAGDMMGGVGIRRLDVNHAGDSWSAGERWTSRGLKPYFNDFVVHEGHAYGFDGSILSCIETTNGERRWKGGRYGNGQLLLLARQDLLLVLSEEGALALVHASPDGFSEVARFQAIDGKTWNHPVLVGDLLLVRNGEEMAAFRLPREKR